MAVSFRCLLGLAVSALLPLLPLGCASTAPHETATATGSSFPDLVEEDVHLSMADHSHFYSPLCLAALAASVGVAAPMANGSADEDVHHWYQERIHRDGMDPVSTTAGIAGQVWVVLPVGLEFARLLGHVDEEAFHDGGLFEWSNRSLRACAVGYPPILALFGLLGGDRPSDGPSHWEPLHGFHGVSGHTFVGAVPFLTAAAMTDNVFLKAPLIVGSFATGWSRIHDDKHYLSQVLLGWWIAALATWSVDQTQQSAPWSITPTADPDGAGVALQWRF